MRKIFFTSLAALPLFLVAQTAKIKIDIDRTIGEIDPKIYGVFMEPIHFSGRMIWFTRYCRLQYAVWKSVRSIFPACR